MQVQLKTLCAADKEALAALYTTADRRFLSDRLPYPYTEQDAAEWLKIVRDHDGRDGLFRAIVVDGRLVGTISVEQKSDIFRRDAEIGFLLETTQWSRGVMTEAVRQMCALAFKELAIVRLTGLVYEENIASRKVLEKNGFCLEGVMQQAVTKNDGMHNLCVYGKLKDSTM